MNAPWSKEAGAAPRGWRFRRVSCLGMVLLWTCSLAGCVETLPHGAAAKDAGGGCVSGNCVNGEGVFRQPTGKYVRVSTGTFKDGILWEGRVDQALGNMDAIVIQEVKGGKIIWERSRGR